MEKVVLSTNGLTKEYKGLKANNNISIQIIKGDICGFIGENGAGKSTFMRIITGLIKSTSGTFELLGAKKGKELEAARRMTGVLIEHPALCGDMTAMQNLIIQGRFKGIRKKNGIEKYKQILERVGLFEVKDKKVREFSLGMKQRMGLAIALVGDPEFIILDEPYVSLDPVGVSDFRKLFLELHDEGKTILFSCHTLSEMTKLATKYVFIHKGLIRKELTADQLERELKENNEDLEAFFLRHITMWNGKIGGVNEKSL